MSETAPLSPSRIEAVQARFAAAWDILRDIHVDGSHGDWIALSVDDGREIRAASVGKLARLLEQEDA